MVATCFFLDTAHNVLDYLATISSLLLPGGVWINQGPLLYHFADTPGEVSLELTWNDIKAVLPQFKLKLVEEATGVESGYTTQPHSMMQTVYKCAFSVCVKEE